MRNRNKNGRKIFELSLLVFICLLFFTSSATAYWEYQSGGFQTTICGYALNALDACNAAIKSYCGNGTTATCVSSNLACNSSSQIIMNSSLCPQVQTVTGQKNQPTVNTPYTLLAPIGSMNTAPTNFGDYVNTIFLIIIGLCAVLAVVMIVIGGITYMGDESVFGKTEAKKQIGNAILGLLIALGAWVILNTINPDLLKLNLKVNKVTAAIPEEENITAASVGPGVVLPNGTTVKVTPGAAAACSSGTLTNVPSSMGSGQICSDLLAKLNALAATGVSFTITSTVRSGNALSSCHYAGNATSGNCADIIIAGTTTWDQLCLAVAQISGLNFANEATSAAGSCQSLKPYKTYSTTTGAHLHVNFIG